MGARIIRDFDLIGPCRPPDSGLLVRVVCSGLTGVPRTAGRCVLTKQGMDGQWVTGEAGSVGVVIRLLVPFIHGRRPGRCACIERDPLEAGEGQELERIEPHVGQLYVEGARPQEVNIV